MTNGWRASRSQASASVLVLVIGSMQALDSADRSSKQLMSCAGRYAGPVILRCEATKSPSLKDDARAATLRGSCQALRLSPMCLTLAPRVTVTGTSTGARRSPVAQARHVDELPGRGHRSDRHLDQRRPIAALEGAFERRAQLLRIARALGLARRSFARSARNPDWSRSLAITRLP